jgi:pimeloyl-ACP methyl ester carboxylesterase
MDANARGLMAHHDIVGAPSRSNSPEFDLEVPTRATAARRADAGGRGRRSNLPPSRIPLVILAHGWGGRAAQMIDLAEAVAASGFQAVAIDAPGHGTDEQTTSDGFQMAAGLRALESRYGPPGALVTHSIGAMAAVLAFGEAPAAAAVFLAPVLDLRDPLRLFSDRAKLAPWTTRSLSRRVRSFTGESWPVITAAAQADLPGEELLIVHDPADEDAPFTTSARLATQRSLVQLVEVPGLGHNQLLRDSGVVEATALSDRSADDLAARTGRPAAIP